MKQLLNYILLIICSISIVGCAEMSNQDAGTVAGGIAGGILGSQIGGGSGRLVAIAAGSLIGAYLGGSIGRHMDEHDRVRVRQALESNNIGEPAYWQNADSGNTYEIIPTRNVTIHGNRYCREYHTVASIGGRKQEMYGTACRQPDGSWKAVN